MFLCKLQPKEIIKNFLNFFKIFIKIRNILYYFTLYAILQNPTTGFFTGLLVFENKKSTVSSTFRS